MVAARWRIRRLWTIETCLLDSEMMSVHSPLDATGAARQEPEAPADPGLHLARAFRTLADERLKNMKITKRTQEVVENRKNVRPTATARPQFGAYPEQAFVRLQGCRFSR